MNIFYYLLDRTSCTLQMFTSKKLNSDIKTHFFVMACYSLKKMHCKTYTKCKQYSKVDETDFAGSMSAVNSRSSRLAMKQSTWYHRSCGPYILARCDS